MLELEASLRRVVAIASFDRRLTQYMAALMNNYGLYERFQDSILLSRNPLYQALQGNL